MSILIIFLIFFQIIYNFGSDIRLNKNDLDVLINNLIENLRADIFLDGDFSSGKLTETSKEFIDKYTERYKKLMLTSKENELIRSKRSLNKQEKEKVGVAQDYITDISYYGNKTSFAPRDAVFFEQNSQWYAALIIKNATNEKYYKQLHILKYQNNEFITIAKSNISNGLRLAAFPIKNSTIIVIAENGTNLNYTNIYELNSKENLEIIQKVNGSGYSDVAIWEDNGNVFMSLVGFMGNSSSFWLYKWHGRHFNAMPTIPDIGITKITPFRINDQGFLAVVKNVPQNEETNVYSTILKYNFQTNRYMVFQNILTYAGEDIKYFEIPTEHKGKKESYLIIANKRDFFDNYQQFSIVYKFVDNYFMPFQTIKLNGVRQWESIVNEHGEVLLVALTLEGFRTFQYDGWFFTESEINYTEGFKNNEIGNIEIIHSYRIHHKNLLVIPASKNNYLLLEIKFSSKHKLREIHDQLLTWCKDTTKLLDKRDESILERVRRDDENAEISSDSEKLTADLNKYNTKLIKIQQKLNDSLQSSKSHTIERNIEANRISINSTDHIESILTHKFNKKEINKILDQILNVNDCFQIDSDIKIDYLRTEQNLEFKNFNQHPVDSIIYKNIDNKFNNIIINGSAIFKSNITIRNLNNDIKINQDYILLKNGDQNLDNLKITEVKADKIRAKNINGHSIINNRARSTEHVDKEKLTTVKTLKIKNLVVGGFLNDVEVPTLDKYALRKSGKQVITAHEYYFDRVESELLDTDQLPGTKIPDDLILINKGDYIIDKSLLFTNPLTIKNLTAIKHLNSIPVTHGGKLKLLLKDVPFQQYVTGLKTIKNLEILNPINIRGKLNGKEFDRINPLKNIKSDIIIDDDVIITGNVFIEDLLKSMDISEGTKNMGLLRVIQQGIKLADKNINISVEFLKHINVNEINAERFNDYDPNNWVVAGAKHPQIIKGYKTFKGDLEITGNTNVLKINNAETKEFENNILKTDGDQIISGKHEVDNVIILGELKTNNTKFGKQAWKNVLTLTGNQTINSIIVNDLCANSTLVKDIKIDGKINGIDFLKLVHDAVSIDEDSKIFGNKNFHNLNINNLWIKNNIGAKKKIQEIENNNLILENISNIKNITAKNVYFNNQLNGIDKIKYNSKIIDDNGKIKINGNQKFEKIIVYGTVFLESNRFNHIDIEDVEKNCVKTDQPEHLQNVEIGDIFVPNFVSLKGQIENLDLDNIFENTKQGSKNQIIVDKINFREGLSVNGIVNITGRLNGVKISDLCDITTKFGENKKLTIEGNVHFVKGPRITEFNGITDKKLNNVWFTDAPATLYDNVAFLANVTLREDIKIDGLLNKFNIVYLSKNYLSKTKDQKIFAHLNFSNGTIFLRDVITSNISVNGKINNINLNEFLKTIILHRPQLYEDVLYFKQITTKELEGDYLVNKLNLHSEVMRYDKPNLITGPKSFGNLDVDVLRPKREGITVQEVDVRQWLGGAVLNDGGYKIGGRKKFVNVEVNESTNLIGRLNNKEWNKNNIFLKNIAQNMTGKIKFSSKYSNELRVKGMKIKGNLNNDDFSKILNNQANKYEDNIFKSTLQLYNNTYAKNINFEKEYYGINVSELLNNISNIGSLRHITKNYINLMDMAKQVENSLKNQAFYFDYFKLVPSTFDVTEIFSINCGSHNKIVGFKNDNGSNIMNFLEWDNKQKIFTTCCSKRLGPYPNYINKVNIDGVDTIYMEHRNKSKTEDNTHTGQLMYCNDNSTEIRGRSFLTKGTLFLTSFSIKSKKLHCLLFIDFNFDINIPCSGPNKEFIIHQIIKNKHPIMASIEIIDDIPYLIIINKDDDKKTVIWKLNQQNQFEIYQSFYVTNAISISTISSYQGTFFAVASKHLSNTKDFGKIIIRRLDKSSHTFPIYQTIRITSPSQILFSQLPSNEIALYITTENPSKPFIAYLYEGASGFVEKIGSSIIAKVNDIKNLSIKNQHFIVVKHNNDLNILEGIFKGIKYDKDGIV